jgi:hypothetical protein
LVLKNPCSTRSAHVSYVQATGMLPTLGTCDSAGKLAADSAITAIITMRPNVITHLGC